MLIVEVIDFKRHLDYNASRVIQLLLKREKRPPGKTLSRRRFLFGGKNNMRIALAQLNPTIGALDYNAAKIVEYYLQARQKKADLVVFTELSLSGYPPRDLLNYNSFLEKEKNLLYNKILPLTAGGPPILIGATHQKDNRLYNAAFLLEHGAVKSVHLKTLLPFFDVFDEPRYFTSCTERRVEQLGNLPTAIAICEDIWNDNEFFTSPLYDIDPLEQLFKGGTQLLINLSASPYHLGKHKLRETMLPFLAKKHQCGIVYLNQVGGNDELIFDGSSLVYNNRGELIYRAAFCEEELFFVETEDLYRPAAEITPPDRDDIETISRLLQLGLKDYLSKTGFTKVVLGLSGGIDSAVVAALAARAVGAENVLGVLMPSPYSSTHSISDAKALAENLGIEYRVIEINKPFQAYLETLNNNREPLMDLAEENLQARIRGDILMHLSCRENRLVLVPGNKSELAVGYCTLYGDMSGALAVISDLTKTRVYELAKHINNNSSEELIPQNSINKTPSAELSPGQTDQDSLPPYDVLDPIVEMFVEKNLSPAEIIAAGFDKETVEKTTCLIDRAEYKRYQAAPGFRVTEKAFGTGRRMPIARGYNY